MTKCVAQLKVDESLLNKLDDAQRATAISNQDLAHILDITPSYLTVLRRRLQVSARLRRKFEYVIKTLLTYQKDNNRPIFEKGFRESVAAYKHRRAKLVASFKSAFTIILTNLNIEG